MTDPHLVLWGLVAVSVLTLNAPSEIRDTLHHLRVPNTDDAMRLVGVRDLIAGQGWFDNVQSRFLPPAGVASHWSRLVDAPLAGSILALGALVGRPLAEGLTAAFWPMLLLALYGTVLYRGVRPVFGRTAAILAVLVATQTLGLTVQFRPGRVDHHNLQIVAILGLAFGAVRGGGRGGATAGLLAALSLAIGLEGLPYIALGGLFLVGDWVLRGRPARAAFLGFGLGLGLLAPVLFGIQTAPALWPATACDALSPPWLWLAAGGGALAAACAALDRHLAGPAVRFGVLAGLGLPVLAGFAVLFPTCLGGPFPGMTPLVREHWLLTVNEMASLAKFVARRQWEALVFYPPLALATFAATWGAVRAPAEQRRTFALAAPFLWTGLILGGLEFRGTYVAAGFIPLVGGAVIARAFGRRGPDGPNPGFAPVMLGAGLVSTVWLAPAYLAQALTTDGPGTADPVGAVACHADAAVAPLSALPRGTVLAPIFLGPSILLRTPHAIVAAPYHRAIAGLTAAIEGLGGAEADLRRTVAAFGIDYVVACPARPADDIQAEPAFATRLARGAPAPDWLEPLPLAGPLMVWKVVRSRLPPPSSRAQRSEPDGARPVSVAPVDRFAARAMTARGGWLRAAGGRGG